MRMYCLTNMYYSGVAVGIQSQHSTVDMIYKYLGHDSSKSAMIKEWATKHKTVIALNAGNHRALEAIKNSLNQTSLPFCEFYEPDNNNSLSSISVLLNEEQYTFMKEYSKSSEQDKAKLRSELSFQHSRYGKLEKVIDMIAGLPTAR